MIMGIDQQVSLAAVTREVDLTDSLRWNSRQIFHRGETVIHGADIYVVNVQQNSAVSFLGDRGKKDPFRHGRNRIGQVAGNILHQDAASKLVLNLANSSGNVPHRFFSAGKRQEIVGKTTADCSPTKMIGNPRRIKAPNQQLEFRQIVLSQRIGPSDIERHAMKNDRSELAGLFQYLQRAPARDHEVFRDYFEPVRTSRFVQNVRIVNGPQTDTVT